MEVISHESSGDDYHGSWCSAEVECPMCGQQQVSVYPATCMRLQCAGCLMMMPAPVVLGQIEDYNVVLLPLEDRDEALAIGLYYATRC